MYEPVILLPAMPTRAPRVAEVCWQELQRVLQASAPEFHYIVRALRGSGTGNVGTAEG